MIAAVLIEQEPGPPVYRAGAGRWVAALCVIVSALVLLPAAASAPNTKFVSKQYGYSIVLPGNSSRWFSSLARVTWSTGTISPDTAAFDTFTDLRTTGCTSSGRERRRRDPRSRSRRRRSSRSAGQNPRHAPRSRTRSSPARRRASSRGRAWTATTHRDHRAPRPARLLHDRRLTDDEFRASNRTAFNSARTSFRFLPQVEQPLATMSACCSRQQLREVDLGLVDEDVGVGVRGRSGHRTSSSSHCSRRRRGPWTQ